MSAIGELGLPRPSGRLYPGYWDFETIEKAAWPTVITKVCFIIVLWPPLGCEDHTLSTFCIGTLGARSAVRQLLDSLGSLGYTSLLFGKGNFASIQRLRASRASDPAIVGATATASASMAQEARGESERLSASAIVCAKE